MSVLLGLSCTVVSLWEEFAEPEYRGVRADMFDVSFARALLYCCVPVGDVCSARI